MERNQVLAIQAFLKKPVLDVFFQLTKTQSDIYIKLSTDFSLEISLRVFGHFLRNKRETYHLKGRNIPIPAPTAVTIYIKPISSVEDKESNFQSYFEGLVCCEEKPTRGWYEKITFSNEPDQKLEFRLAPPTHSSLNWGNMLNDHRIFVVDETGEVTEKFLHTQEQLNALFAQKQREIPRIPVLRDEHQICEVLSKKPPVSILDDEDRSTLY